MATLKVKNVSGADLTLKHGNGSDTVEIKDGDEQALEEGYLLGKDFAKKIRAGQITFAAPGTTLSAKERNLARVVFPTLLRRVGRGLVDLHASVKASIEHLDGLRTAYNAAHGVTTKMVTDGKAGATGAENLAKAAAQWLNVKPEEAAVEAAEQAILTHKGENATPANFDTWFAALQILEEKLADAQRVLAFAKGRYVDEFAKLSSDLGTAGTELKTLDPAKTVGKVVPDFP